MVKIQTLHFLFYVMGEINIIYIVFISDNIEKRWKMKSIFICIHFLLFTRFHYKNQIGETLVIFSFFKPNSTLTPLGFLVCASISPMMLFIAIRCCSILVIGRSMCGSPTPLLARRLGDCEWCPYYCWFPIGVKNLDVWSFVLDVEIVFLVTWFVLRWLSSSSSDHHTDGISGICKFYLTL